MIVLKIDVKKIDKELLFKGEKGIYLDCALSEKPNEYGDDGYITQSVGKERRAAGERGPIIGNWRNIETQKPKPKFPKPPTKELEDDEIPW